MFNHFTGGESAVTEEQLDAMIVETRAFVPVSHFFWGVWALLQVELSPVEFGFEVSRDPQLLFHLIGCASGVRS